MSSGIKVESWKVVEEKIWKRPGHLTFTGLLFPEQEQVRKDFVLLINKIPEYWSNGEGHADDCILTIYIHHQTRPLAECTGCLFIYKISIILIEIIILPGIVVHYWKRRGKVKSLLVGGYAEFIDRLPQSIINAICEGIEAFSLPA